MSLRVILPLCSRLSSSKKKKTCLLEQIVCVTQVV
jgi:hypothetical protein